MSETLLELRHVTRVFDLSQGVFRRAATLTAVAGVSLKVRRGEVFALVGESGSGKTTLAKMLLGLLPPTSGEILIGGKAISADDRVAVSRRVQPIFQDPYSSLNPRKSVAQLIALPLVVHGVGDGTERRAKVLEMLDLVGLSRRHYDAYPGQLSGGLRQRVMIAMALMCGPDLIIADEPTTALDVTIQAQILHLLADLKNEFGMAMILISHDLGVVARVADKVAVMYAGEVVESAASRQLFKAPRHPYTRGLLNCIPVPGRTAPGAPLGAIPGQAPTLIGPQRGCAFRDRCAFAAAECEGDIPFVAVAPGHHARCIRLNALEAAA